MLRSFLQLTCTVSDKFHIKTLSIDGLLYKFQNSTVLQKMSNKGKLIWTQIIIIIIIIILLELKSLIRLSLK